MPAPKRNVSIKGSSIPLKKKLRTTKQKAAKDDDDTSPTSRDIRSCFQVSPQNSESCGSASSLPPFLGASMSSSCSSQQKNDAGTSLSTVDGPAKDIGFIAEEDLIETPIENLIAAGFSGLSDADAVDDELIVNDKDLNVSDTTLHKKSALYEALRIPLAAENTPGEVLIDLLRGPADLKQQVVNFARTCKITDRDASPLPTDTFLRQPQPETWETQCQVSNSFWDEWLSDCQDLGVPKVTLNNAAKISGPAKGNLHIIWHHPTHRNGRAMFGFTADPKNSCLNLQHRRIGPSPRVCTNDLVPLRANYARTGVQWESIIPNSVQVLERSVDLTMGLLNKSRVTMLVGREVYKTVTARLENDPSKEIHKLYLPIHKFSVFGDEPFVLVVRCKDTKQIENLIFISIHLQSFNYLCDPTIALYYDFLWNAACEIANIPVVGGDVLYRFVSCGKSIDKPSGTTGQLALAITYRRIEKLHGIPMPEALTLQIFNRSITSNPEWWAANFPDQGGKSVVQLVISLFNQKSVETRSAQGFEGLARGRETQRAGGFQSLQKGTKASIETHRANGFQNLKEVSKKGHDTQKAQKVARLVALLNTCQARQLLAKPSVSLTSKERDILQHLRELGSCIQTQVTTERCRKFLSTHVIFWSKKNPFGVRFEGDNATVDAPSTSAYTNAEHPCVSLHRQLTSAHKEFARKGPIEKSVHID